MDGPLSNVEIRRLKLVIVNINVGVKNPNLTGAIINFRRTNEYLLIIKLWDKDNVSIDYMIAQGIFPIKKDKKVATLNEWMIPLSYKGKDAGKILLKIDFFANFGK